MYIFAVFSTCFVVQATDHNSQRILMYYGSKDSVWRKDVPFEYPTIWHLVQQNHVKIIFAVF